MCGPVFMIPKMMRFFLSYNSSMEDIRNLHTKTKTANPSGKWLFETASMQKDEAAQKTIILITVDGVKYDSKIYCSSG